MILAALDEAEPAGARLHAACQVIGVSALPGAAAVFAGDRRVRANDSALAATPGPRRPPVRATPSSGPCAHGP